MNDYKQTQQDLYRLFKNKSLELISDIENYANGSKCAICKGEIVNPSIPDHFNLYHCRDQIKYITFHFKCAFKKNSGDRVNDLLPSYDYIYSNNNDNKEEKNDKKKQIYLEISLTNQYSNKKFNKSNLFRFFF